MARHGADIHRKHRGVLHGVVAAGGPLGPKIDPIDLYPHQYATEWAILDQVANRFGRIR
jgi:hypothetical protein